MLKSLFILLTIFSNNVLADTNDIVKGLNAYFPNVTKEDISPTPFLGLYEVILREPRLDVIYISEDGRYLSQGEVIDLKTRKNLTQSRVSSLAKEILATTTDNEKVIYKADDEKYIINVFTDVDCPFCRQLHKDIVALNKSGITMKYLAFPRSGVNTKSYYRSVAIWCADDQKQAMDRGMIQKDNPLNKCENPVIDHLVLAKKLNVTGTPFIFFENGDHIPGYVKPKELLKELKRSLAKYQ
ncbi:DsbC family protein [Candidatus Thioglobus sp.]|jgi:Protein-disulfide isomerase|uniref:DsbC family protein n=1 Tax=Candidatus Thioglobus sp. TaxID=2026721 RepID=UPI001764B01B|nr:DsbC family protein [Candidatus Thioglobus sp.]